MARKKAPRYRVQTHHGSIYAYDRVEHWFCKRFVTRMEAVEWCALKALEEEGIDVNATVTRVPHRTRSRKRGVSVPTDAIQRGSGDVQNPAAVPASVDDRQAGEWQRGGAAFHYDPATGAFTRVRNV